MSENQTVTAASTNNALNNAELFNCIMLSELEKDLKAVGQAAIAVAAEALQQAEQEVVEQQGQIDQMKLVLNASKDDLVTIINGGRELAGLEPVVELTEAEIEERRAARKAYHKRKKEEHKLRKAAERAAEMAAQPVSEERLNQLASHFDKRRPAPARAALFLPPGRAAGQILKSIAEAAPARKTFVEDGLDHINVGINANTDMGQALDLYSNVPFHHPELSSFHSVAGLMNFVKSGMTMDIFRQLSGDKVRQAARRENFKPVKGIRMVAADATWVKILQIPDLCDDFAASTLPITNYFYYGAVSIRKPAQESAWYTRVLEEIRATLKKRVATGQKDLYPDFSFLESEAGRNEE